MKFSVSGWSYRNWFTEQKRGYDAFLGELKRLGADGYELFPAYLDQNNLGREIETLAQKSRDQKLEVSALCVGNDFAWPFITGRAENVEAAKKKLEYCAAAGISRVNIFTGYHREGQDPIAETYRVIDGFREILPVAEKHNITLCLENHSSVWPQVDELLWFIRTINSPLLKTNPDPSNVLNGFADLPEKAREWIYTSLEKFMPLAANFHLKVRDFTPSGEHAHLDIPRIAKIVKAAGYKGHIVLEYFGAGDPVASTELGMAMLRKHFAA